MTEITILSKRHRRTKEPLIITSETWEQMQANGQARNYIVVSTTASSVDEMSKAEYIRKFTESVKQKTEHGIEYYIAEYKKYAKTDPAKAEAALAKAAQINPDNTYVKRQLLKQK